MPGHDIIAIGASAGGIQVLQEITANLPGDLPASIFVVVHTSPNASGVLPHILNRRGNIPCEYGVDDRPIQEGRIYIAPPDHHLLIKPGRLCVTRGPKENGFRPAVDPLFRTAARAYGPRVIGVVLSGGLDDGTTGLGLIKQFGGVAVVQDPDEAPFPSMPASAIQNVDVDRVLKAAEIPAALVELAHQPVPEGAEFMAHKRPIEPDVAELGTNALSTDELSYPPSGFTCPECGGALWELRDGRLLRFRCHVGHGYTAETLLGEQTNGLETALWSALRALEENAALRRRMAERARKGHFAASAHQYDSQAQEAEVRAAVIRKVLLSEPGETSKMKGTRPKRGRPAHHGHPGKLNSRPSQVRKTSQKS